MSHESDAREAAPVTATDRVFELDVVRGVALFGVLLINIVGFARHDMMATEQQLLALPTQVVPLAVVPVILAFYPKAFTPGCTKQNAAFRDRFAEVEKKGATVLGISTDDVETQKRFKAEMKLPYPLLSDGDGAVLAIPELDVVAGGLPQGLAVRLAAAP